MIRYEALMHWRRRGLPLVIGLWLVAMWGFSLLIVQDSLEQKLPVGIEVMRRLSVTMLGLVTTAGPSIIFGGIVLAILAAETLPLDRQWNVQEWLGALPLGPGTYLGGKVGGLWAVALAGCVFNALAWGLGLRLLHGEYDLGLYLKVWGTVVAPLALFVSALSALLPAGLRGAGGRRPALMLGLAVAVLSYVLLLPLLFDYVSALYSQLLQSSVTQLVAEVCGAQPESCAFSGSDLSFKQVPMAALWRAVAACLALLSLVWGAAYSLRRRNPA